MEENQEKKEHLRLASVVKSVHADLRKQLRSREWQDKFIKSVPKRGDHEAVWSQHCQDHTLLAVYADCMQKLAQDHWRKKSQTRIDWCRQVIREYFLDEGLKKVLEKELKKQAFEENRKLHSNVADDDDDVEACSGAGAVHSKTPQSAGKLVKGEAGDPSVHATDTQRTSSLQMCFGSLKTKELCFQETAHSCAGNSSGVQKEADWVIGISHERGDADCDDGLVLEKSEQSSSNIYTQVRLPFEDKIRLLDVGSCYNPFLEFDEFLAVGIDISPAHESVHYCDFLHLETTEPLQVAPDTLSTYLSGLHSPIQRLPRCSFHAVVFSLLLEYFPAPYQRWLCCTKAHELLQDDGLLVIVTPDSHSQHRNAPMMRSWKKAIESMGFARWRYVKQEHLHCMAFRKTRRSEGAGSALLVGDVTPDLLYIPQDLADAARERAEQLSRDPFLHEDDLEEQEKFFQRTFGELPAFVPDDCGEPPFYFGDDS